MCTVNMVHAFVFVDVAPGTAEKLPPMLSEVEDVGDAHVVAGDHDVVLEVEADAVYDVLSTVTEEVRPLAGVEGTRTYVALE
jgi:DNA-binding Lrp family transcriptional regulator